MNPVNRTEIYGIGCGYEGAVAVIRAIEVGVYVRFDK
jgi:hypothetical protein